VRLRKTRSDYPWDQAKDSAFPQATLRIGGQAFPSPMAIGESRNGLVASLPLRMDGSTTSIWDGSIRSETGPETYGLGVNPMGGSGREKACSPTSIAITTKLGYISSRARTEFLVFTTTPRNKWSSPQGGQTQKGKVWTSGRDQGNPLRLNDQESVTERVGESNEGIVEFVNNCRKKKGMPEGTIPHGHIQNSKRHSSGIENQVPRESSKSVE